MPGIGEVQLFVRLLQDADDEGVAFHRLDERRDIATAEPIGEALQIGERQCLLRQRHHKMIEQRLAQEADLFAVRAGESEADDMCAKRAAALLDAETIFRVNRCCHRLPPVSV